MLPKFGRIHRCKCLHGGVQATEGKRFVQWSRVTVAAMLAWLGFAGGLLCAGSQAAAQTLRRDGTVEIAGRALTCSKARIGLDRRIPSEGAAAPGILLLNPVMLKSQPTAVRLFVFHHECGHLHVGASELAADCWAVERGVRDGWLDPNGIKDVCRSFDGMPATETHPSAKRRCRNLDQCFASSLTAVAASRAPATVAAPAPQLVSGPTLVSNGVARPPER